MGGAGAGVAARVERAEKPPVPRENVLTRAGSGVPSAGNARRALGDIGNLVGAMQVRCHVNKDSAGNTVKQQEVVQTWGAKQRRTAITGPAEASLKIEVSSTDSVPEDGAGGDVQDTAKARKDKDMEAAIPIPVPAGNPPRMKPLTRGRAAAAAKKLPSWTATLTARSEAIGRLCDSEMAEAEEPVRNIDEGDINNQLCVVDYVEDIYSFYRQTEVQSCVAPDYMSRQNDINDKMRAILIDWLIEVHLKFGLMPETLFLTTNLLDRYLSVEKVSRKSLQLVGVTAMLLAAKYEEIIAPEVEAIVFISDDAYTRRQVLAMEKAMLNTLRFHMTLPTPYVFIVRFLKAASSDKQMELLSFFFVELCLTEYVAIKHSPSMLAASAVYAAHHTLSKMPCWSPTLIRHSGYTEAHLRDCARLMIKLHRTSGQSKLVVVHKKYSSPKFQSVAELKPATSSLFDDAECDAGSSSTTR